jgi:hypothetical protein
MKMQLAVMRDKKLGCLRFKLSGFSKVESELGISFPDTFQH